MAPQLAVQYTSDQAESSLGVGFRLQGLSAITRCPRTLAQDGRRRQIKLDALDAFCLDGERLVRDTASPPGTIQYRTEHDALLRITEHASGAALITGPTHFVVEHPDGSVHSYGTHDNARKTVVRDDARLVVSWLIREVRDFSGNTITYEYDHITPVAPVPTSRLPLELVQPRRIRYTGFRGRSRSSIGDRVVDFEYLDPWLDARLSTIEPNPNAKQGWFLGHYYLGDNARRLSKITTSVSGEPVREYRFEGSHDQTSGRWRIDTIQGCAHAPAAAPGGDEDGFVCLPATRFSWRRPLAPAVQPAEDGFPMFDRYEFTWPNRKKTWEGDCADGVARCRERNPVVVLDMNGDGADDLVYLVDDGDTRWRLAVRLGGYQVRGADGRLPLTPYRVETLTSVTNELPLLRYTTIDYNHDGLDDILYVRGDGQTVLLRSHGTDFSVVTTGLPRFDTEPFDTGSGRWMYADHVNADINGDGRTDLLICQWDRTAPTDRASTWHYALRTDDGFSAPVDSGIVTNCAFEEIDSLSVPWFYESFSPGKVVGDYDADGIPDVLIAPDLWVARSEFFRILRWNHAANSLEAVETNLRAYPDSPGNTVQRPFPVDLNGDGSHDIVGLNPYFADTASRSSVRYHHRMMSLGEDGRFVEHNPDSGPNTQRLGRDFGDALLRMMRMEASSGSPRVHSRLDTLGFDVNGDGRGDLLLQTLYEGDLLPHAVGGDVFEWSSSELWSLVSKNGFDEQVVRAADQIRGPRMNGGVDAHTFYAPRVLRVDADGDGALDLLEFVEVSNRYALSNPPVRLHHNVRAAPMLVSAVTNGLGARHEASYEPLSNRGVYTPGTLGCQYPVRCVTNSRYVVHELALDDGIGGHQRLRYHYSDGRADLRGRGWLGFGERTVTDTVSGRITKTRYGNHIFDEEHEIYPYANRPIAETVRSVDASPSPDDTLRAIATSVFPRYEVVAGTIPGTYRVQTTGTNTLRHQSMSVPSSTTVLTAGMTLVWDKLVSRTFDAYGNVLTETTTHSASSVNRVRTATYHNDTENWWLGLARTHHLVATEDDCQIVQRSSTEYIPGQPRVESITVQRPEGALTTSFAYDRYGNVRRVQRSADGYTPRRKWLRFDRDGYFPERSINARGHTTLTTHSPRNGRLLHRIDPNGLESSWHYDGFGRIRRRHTDGGATVTSSYEAATSPGAVMMHVETLETGSETRIQTDRLGRIRYQSGNTNGVTYEQEMQYDGRGAFVRSSAPYQIAPSASAPTAWATAEVDNLGLVRRQTNLDGEATEYWYQIRESRVRDGAGHVSTTTFDALGRLSSTIESVDGGTTTNTYCVDQLRTITDPFGYVTSVERDSLGRRSAVIEPNSGRTTFSYTPFGEISSTIDGAGRQISFEYDVLGRLERRTNHHDGTVSEFEFDSAPRDRGGPWRGYLHRAIGPDGVVDEVAYDNLGRATRTTRTIGLEELTTQLDFDSIGRLRSVEYPSAATAPSVAPLRIDYAYSISGDLQRVTRGSSTLWENVAPSPFALPAAIQLGNGIRETRAFTNGGRLRKVKVGGVVAGIPQQPIVVDYTYSARGLVERRFEISANGRTENYEYDSVGRLTAVGSTDPRFNQQYSYDQVGNLRGAHDVGSLVYPTLGEPQPHAVQEVGGTAYVYDAVGNVVQRGSTTISYNQWNLPTEIIGSTTTSLEYAADGTRAARHRDGVTTLYLPKLYERDTKAGETLQERFYVHSSSGVFLQIERKPGSPDHDRYLHRDRLGSVVATTTNEGNSSLAGYDAFGAQLVSSLSSDVSLGFTGHEHELDEGLINMGGRIYDPRARRFMSPDPFVVAPTTQALNRYSYVLNNPTNLVDPSGLMPRHEFQSGQVSGIPEGGYVKDDVIYFPEHQVMDGSASERGGAGPAGESPNAGQQLDSPRGSVESGGNDLLTNVVGGIQVVGGIVEMGVGVAGIIAPEPATSVAGIAMVAHGFDTFMAGIYTLDEGVVNDTVTQQAGESTALGLGASPNVAAGVGIGVDLAAGLGPSLAAGVARRGATAGIQRAAALADDAARAADDLATASASQAPGAAGDIAPHLRTSDNPTGCGMNCVLVSFNVDEALRNGTARRAAGAIADLELTERWWRRVLSKLFTSTSQYNIERNILSRGPGATGLVWIRRPDGTAHMFNVTNIQGHVVYLDAQMLGTQPLWDLTGAREVWFLATGN